MSDEIRFVACDPADQRKADMLTALYRAPLSSDEGLFWLLKAFWIMVDSREQLRRQFAGWELP